MFRRFNGGKVLPFEYFLALEGLKMVNSMSFCATLCHLNVQALGLLVQVILYLVILDSSNIDHTS